jgi:hypothetical protein
MKPNTISLRTPHKGGQRAIALHPTRFQILACGRRFGKTELGKFLAFSTMINDGGTVWWITPTYKMSTEIWRELSGLLKPAITWISAAERALTISNGGKLVVWSAGDTMRGGKADLVIIDEAAMFPSRELWFAAVAPALMDNPKSRAYFLSTPRGRNWFYDVYKLGLDGPHKDPNYKSWNYSSYFNPYMPASSINDIKLSTPERFFEQEYLALFNVDSGEVFKGVAEASFLEYREPYEGRFVFGIDWGRKIDYTAVCVMDMDSKQQVDMYRTSRTKWREQMKAIAELKAKWNPIKIIAEENSMGDSAIEMLEEEGLKVDSVFFTNKVKRAYIELLSINIQKQEISLLNEKIQVNELQAYQMDTTKLGNITYNALSGYHDDTVIALSIANYHCFNNFKLAGAKVPIMPGW